jgi:hypothetical protein
MAIRDREADARRLDFLLSDKIPDIEEVAEIADALEAEIPTTPDVHEQTRKLLEQVVELARRPVNLEGMQAPQVNVHPQVQMPTVNVQAPSVTVNAPAPASAIPWTFEFERFPNGTIKAIHATPRVRTV